MKATWAWIKLHAAMLGSWVLSLVLGVITLVTLRRGSERSLLLQQREHYLHTQVQALTKQRNTLLAKANADEAQVQQLQAEIARYRRSAVALQRDVSRMTSAQVESAYRKRYQTWRQGTQP